MIEQRSFVVLSLTPWETMLPSSAHFLMKVFAKKNKILFVEHPRTYKDDLFAKNKNNCGLRRVMDTLWVLTPPTFLPINFLPQGKVYSLLLRMSADSVARSIRAAMKELQLNAPIFWNSFDVPLGYALLGRLNERLRVYHCFDEIRGQPYVDRHGAPLEERLIEACDLVLTTSPALQEVKRFPHCHFVPNGVEHKFFAQALSRLGVPKDLAQIPTPRIGFFGNIEARLDYGLLEKLLRERPLWQLVLIGPAVGYESTMSALSRYKNFHWLGPRPYELAPNYLKGFDAGIIPYVRSLQTSGIYPLKINEYLAAGLPVVLTDFAPLDEFKDFARIAAAKDFLDAVGAALLENSRNERSARSHFASFNSWENRAERISALLLEALEEKR